MKTIKGRITLLIDRESTRIQIKDDESNVTFVTVELTPYQLSCALSRLGDTECVLTVAGLDKVGKKMEHDTFEFKLPDWVEEYRVDENKLGDYVNSILTDGWVTDGYFRSQNSLFNKNNERWGRCTIRRWVEIEKATV